MDKFVTVTRTRQAITNSKTHSRTGDPRKSRFEVLTDTKDATKRLAASSRQDEYGQLSDLHTQTLTRHLINTLSDDSNPITHSDSGLRAYHVSSTVTGHQRGEHRGNQKTYIECRAKKLEEQAISGDCKILHNVRVYINGYLQDTTDIEMKRSVVQAGGRVMQSAAGATHILTSQQLSAGKTHKLLTSKTPSKVSVVRPEWVTDSIKAGRRLPERKYHVVSNEGYKNTLVQSK